MKRRSFISGTTTALSGIGLSTLSHNNPNKGRIIQPLKVCTTLDQEKVSFHFEVINESIKVVHIADTHLFMDDERGIPFQKYSNRMAKAYNQTTHFQTREKTSPKKSFEQTIGFAKKVNADLITLVGDIFSFPSELAIEWVTISYFTGAGLSLFAPPPLVRKKVKGFNSIKVHKWLAYIHFSGMIATNAYSKENMDWHKYAAYTTFASYASAVLVFKF